MVEEYDDAPAGSPPDKEARIDYLAHLMCEARYRTRYTARALGKKWGLESQTVANDACDASRMLRLTPEQREEYRTRWQLFCEKIAHEARTNLNQVTLLADYKSALAAAELAAKFAGVDAVTPATATPPVIQVVYGEKKT